MGATVTVTGHLGADPEVHFTANGNQVVTLSIAATTTHRDKNTGEWTPDGDPLWINAPFWGDQHTHLADTLRKGDKVSVTGTLIRRDYTTRDGRQGTSLDLKFPLFLGKINRQAEARQTSPKAQTGASAASWAQPAGGATDDPWSATPQPQQGGFDYDALPPF